MTDLINEFVRQFIAPKYRTSTYCDVRNEDIRTDEIHLHYDGLEGERCCDKIVDFNTPEVEVIG